MAYLNQQITTITFLEFERLSAKWWALRQMRDSHRILRSIPGLGFYKLLGSGGGNGFSIIPDMSTYAFLAVWDKQTIAKNFFQQNSFWHQACAYAQHHWTVSLCTTKVKGSWEAKQPFPVHKVKVSQGPIAVLTRATIYPQKLWSFWKNVPKVSNRLEQHEAGLLFSKGIGELPLLQQATFSLWKNRDAMVAYAYQSAKHREMIKKTRILGWYREELFAEFTPLSIEGNWPQAPNISPYI